MDWSDGLGSLRRGLGIARRVAAARLREHGAGAPTFPLLKPGLLKPGVLKPGVLKPGVLKPGHLKPGHLKPGRPEPDRFVVLPEFGANPGRLRLRIYLPAVPVHPDAPLIVLLHGCGQDAADFAADTGWTALADRLGVPLLLPEQQEANNRQRCFQWFQPGETERGHGEAASIAAMVSAATSRFKSDPRRVFVAGLSAGGAMAAAMLAAYPDLFAAGAVFAGLPVGTATSAVEALVRMASGSPDYPAPEWVERARRVAPQDYAWPWPRLSVWHGDADQIVAPDNGRKLAAQWCALHGLPDKPTRETAHHRVWGDAVELWTLPGLGHAWAIGPGEGRPAQFITPNAVSAVGKIARFWGVA
jgi:poly(hydroxyalkanoate) depolymerase family esterase